MLGGERGGGGERGPACSPPLCGCAKGPLQRRPSWSAVSVLYGMAVCRLLRAPRAPLWLCTTQTDIDFACRNFDDLDHNGDNVLGIDDVIELQEDGKLSYDRLRALDDIHMVH